MRPDDAATLLDWKRRIFSLYAEVRADSDPVHGWSAWRHERDELFARHPQTPLAEGDPRRGSGLSYFDYDATARVIGTVLPADPKTYDIATSGDGSYSFERFASVSFNLRGTDQELEPYWLTGYGGGLFLPFRDVTSGSETYGAGRYLLDTIKGSDLGWDGDQLTLDFNFAYNPSCSYDPRWVCPLAPPPNRLDIEIRAGEKHVDLS
jgi:uncharacterized protein (DUF1684 family)